MKNIKQHQNITEALNKQNEKDKVKIKQEIKNAEENLSLYKSFIDNKNRREK